MSKISWLILFVPLTAWAISGGGGHSSSHSSSHSSAHVSSSSARSTTARSVSHAMPFVFVPGVHPVYYAHHTSQPYTTIHEPSYWYYLSKCLRENNSEECER